MVNWSNSGRKWIRKVAEEGKMKGRQEKRNAEKEMKERESSLMRKDYRGKKSKMVEKVGQY